MNSLLRSGRKALVLAGPLLLAAGPALAAEGLDGAKLSVLWALPFAGMLLSIALGPLLAPHAWEHHQGKIAAFWAALVAVPLALTVGAGIAFTSIMHAVLLEYLPFICLILALFTVAGGIWVRGNIHGSPLNNAILLTVGAFLASFIGTTGASMVMIRPVLRANDNRRHNAHVIVFFIFIVSNIGGALTPLGDPPLFLGFLRGVDFFWPTTNLAAETAFVFVVVMAIFVAVDAWFYRHDKIERPLPDPTPDSSVRVFGAVNFALIAVIIGAILFSASVKLGSVMVAGNELRIENLIRDGVMVLCALASLKLTPAAYRAANGFSWGPVLEVAKLFAAIFICIVPVLAILRAGSHGALAPLVALVSNDDGGPNNLMYFWMTGILSSVLDNAPTYIVFFELAGGDPKVLMTAGAATLAAISSGAVYMGANTYIGNAPNFMVYAIAKNNGVKMPSFFGYMGWSFVVLIPVFVITGFLFFR
jgi:Na+/H+ antiporter NhaD/arsenite permease-like protein